MSISPAKGSPTPRFSVVVPCYNEQGAILQTLASLRESLGEAGGSYELIVVNDGSLDRSKQVLDQAAAEDRSLCVIHLDNNSGYGAALKTGIRHAASEVIVITDADGTYPNQRIPELVDLMDDADMVVGARIADDVTYPLIRRIPKLFLVAYASWIVGHKIPDLNSGMRVFRKSKVQKFLNILPDGFSFTTTITVAMLTNNFRVRYVPIGYSARIGKSKIKPIRDTVNFLTLIVRTGMYFAPLRIFAPVGACLGLGFGVSLMYDIMILRNLTEKTLLLMLFSMNTIMFALLADMIDKRNSTV